MGNLVHKTRAVQVWAEVDEGIADLVVYLNTIPGVRTFASCQGTIGEGGAEPYRPYVMAAWSDAATLERLQREFDVTFDMSSGPRDRWGNVHPRIHKT
jgi:tRNA(Phe) wybutosine-synthesizing methylase Tyw3